MHKDMLHEAAVRGSVDVIVKIGKDKDNSNLINQKDQDEETPVLKAVKNAHFEAVVALVAFGADVNIPDKNGKTPIVVAIENRSPVLVQLLCSIGAHVNLSDWSMELELINTFEKPDRDLLFMIKDQAAKMSDFKHKNIKSSIVYVESGRSIFIEELGITLNPSPHHDIFLRCMQMHPELADVNVPSNPCFFSDIFEFLGWNITNITMTVTLVIPEIPQPNEKLSILPLDGKVSLTSTYIDKKVSRLTFDVDLKRQKIVRFAVIATKIVEVFDVSKNGTTIKPEMEPDSYIKIKPDTFETDLQLQVNFTGTKMWNEDDCSNNCDFLATNLLNITSSDDLQPSKDMEIILPVHTVPADSENLTIFVSDKIQPESDSDWKENNAEVAVTKDNKVKFHIRAFKWCVAALLDATRSSATRSAATRNANQAIKGEKMMKIYAMLKKKDTFYKLVVEFSLLKHFEQKKIKWLTKGYSFESCKERSLCINKMYKISFSGNIIKVERKQKEDKMLENHIIFDIRRAKNYRIFYVNEGEHCTEPEGQVNIGEPAHAEEVQQNCLFECFKALSKVQKPDESLYRFIDVFHLQIGTPVETATDLKGAQHQAKRVFKYVEPEYDLNELQCSYPVLRQSSLRRLGDLLTKDQSITLGQILHVPDEKIKDLQNGQNIGGLILCLWQDKKRPNPGMVRNLAHALQRMKENDLADIVREAMKQETEFNYDYEYNMP